MPHYPWQLEDDRVVTLKSISFPFPIVLRGLEIQLARLEDIEIRWPVVSIPDESKGMRILQKDGGKMVSMKLIFHDDEADKVLKTLEELMNKVNEHKSNERQQPRP